jgi:hypothetical protein
MKVGARHGSPAVLLVAGGARHAVFGPDNGVWLTGVAPVDVVRFPE